MSDYREIGEGQEKDVGSPSKDVPLSQGGQHSMQGPPDAAAPDAPPVNGGGDGPSPLEKVLQDQKYTDAKGRDLTMCTYPTSDGHMVRVYDDGLTPGRPHNQLSGHVALANLQLERDTGGNVKRARLQDIFTAPSYREAGTGGRMLSQCEEIARQNGASEIYGVLDREHEREWYTNRGYAFRGSGNRELHKPLMATIHSSKGPEYPPMVGAEPIATVPIKDQKSAEGQTDKQEGQHKSAESGIQMPEGHHPGGPEAW